MTAKHDALNGSVSFDDRPPGGQSLEAESDPRPGLFRSTLIITAFSVAKMALNFGLQMVLAARFGAGVEMDAYLAASTLPTLVMTVFVTSMNVAFVPVLVEYRVRQREAETWKIVSIFINLASVVLCPLILLAALGAHWVVLVTVPGFDPGSEAFTLTRSLFQVLLPSLLFQCLAAILTSVYYTEKRFGLPSLAVALDSVVILGGTLLLSGPLGIYSIAVATVLGALVQFGFLLPIMFPRGRYRLELDHRHPGIRKVAKLMLPLILSTFLSRTYVIIDRFIASGLPEGSISYLGYAYKIASLLSTLATQGIALSLLPLMSQLAAVGDTVVLRRTVSAGVRLTSFVVTPLVVALYILRVPIVQVWLEHGAFDHQATVATAQALAGYLGWMFVGGVGIVWVNAFYSLQETHTVVKITILGMAVEIPLAFALSRSLGLIGLPLALSIAATISAALFAITLRRRLQSLDGRRVWNSQTKVLLASAAMAVALLGSLFLLSIVEGFIPRSLVAVLQVSIPALIGVSIYLITARLLRCEEVGLFFQWLQSKRQRLPKGAT